MKQLHVFLFHCRMDQNSTIDPANVVRADDKPDIEAELPSRGTSQSLKSKFQALDDGQTKTIDFSQPVKREKPRKDHDRYLSLRTYIN